MAPTGPLNALLASERAEDIKQVTLALRRGFPGCRVEAVYSPGETIEWASLQDWQVIVLDEQISDDTSRTILPAIRASAPNAAIIVHSEQCEENRGAAIIRAGADAFLYRRSPAFLTELLVTTGGSLEKRDLQRRLHAAEDRYRCLLDTMPDVAYELDAAGRFISIGPGVQSLLGYHPEELIGVCYANLVSPEDRLRAEGPFNERRTGARATREFPVRLVAKNEPGLEGTVRPVVLNATGLYGRQGEFLGTIGVIRSAHEAANGPVASADARSAPVGQERRRSPRGAVDLGARFILNGHTWKGTVRNVSLHGLFVVTDGDVPISKGQPVRLGFLSEVGFLEVRAIVRALRREPPREPPEERRARERPAPPGQGLAVEFESLAKQEGQVLASLLKGVQDGAIALSVTIALSPIEEAALLFESGAQASGAASRPSAEDTGPPRSKPSGDRRLSPRLSLAFPGDLSRNDVPATATVCRIATMNLSLGGALVRAPDTGYAPGQRVRLSLAAPDSGPLALAGEVVWIASEADAAAVGIRFLPSTDQGPSRLAAVLSRFLTRPTGRVDGADEPDIVSELTDCRNRRGQRLVLYRDRPRRSVAPGGPVVVIAPAYGETKRDYVRLAYAFACNGFRTLRYDHSHHVGESDGDMRGTTLSRMQEDLSAVLTYAARAWPASPLVAVAAGLAGRAAWKAVGDHERVALLVLLAPTLDVQAALLAQHGQDLISAHMEGRRLGLFNLFGFNVEADRWLDDVVASGYANLQTTVRDAEQLRIPVRLVTAQNEVWTTEDAIAALGASTAPPYRLPRPLSHLADQPEQANLVCQRLVRMCREHLLPFFRDEALSSPGEPAIGRQRRLEAERARLQHLMTPRERIEFWRTYLEHDRHAVNVPEYWQLLDHLVRLIEPLGKGERILDAGCGNGHLGLFLQVHRAYRSSDPTSDPASDLASDLADTAAQHYLGTDVVPAALTGAQRRFAGLLAESGRWPQRPPSWQSPILTSLCLADMNERLPFLDHAFDRVVCNLVLAYLHDPLFSLRELFRVLAPHGRLILSHLTPSADLSHLYRNMIHLTDRPGDREEGLRLLTAWGMIKQGHSEGLFHSFDRGDLLALLEASGAAQPRVYSTFAGQAYVTVTEKPAPPIA